MNPLAWRLGIVGLGVIGGSIATRVTATQPDVQVIGVDVPDVLREAGARRIVHDTRDRVDDLADVDVIVLATPIEEIRRAVRTLAEARTAATVTDVGSTKQSIMEAAESAGLVAFVGGHPMAGSEVSGLGGARPDLFEGRPWALVPGRDASDAEVARVEQFVRGLGASACRVDADVHDRVVAYVSHLPQLMAVALAQTIADECGEDGLELAGPALGEMTRLAASPAGLWQHILRENAHRVAEAVRQFAERLPADPDVLADGERINETFGAARRWRSRLSRT